MADVPSWKKQNLVLDMDETLLHCIGNLPKQVLEKLQENPLLRPLIFGIIFSAAGGENLEYMHTVKRPHVQFFLEYVSQRFNKVIVWSAGLERYVQANINYLTVDNILIWHRDFCDIGPDEELTKPLAKLARIDPEISLENTFIIDDRDTAFTHTNKDNGILIPPFQPAVINLLDVTDECHVDNKLLYIMKYFESPHVKAATDVRELKPMTAQLLPPPNPRLVPAKIVPAPKRSDKLFELLAAAIKDDAIVTQHVLNVLKHDYVHKPIFSQITKKSILDRAGFVSAYGLRKFLVNRLWVDPRNFVETVGVQNWMAPALRDGEVDYDVLLAIIGDKDACKGDVHIIDQVARQLDLRICVWTQHWEIVYCTDVAQALASIQLQLANDEYALVKF